MESLGIDDLHRAPFEREFEEPDRFIASRDAIDSPLARINCYSTVGPTDRQKLIDSDGVRVQH